MIATAETFHCPIRVQFIDTDASRRIHYTSMLRFFEAAEAEFFRHIGARYGHVTNSDIAFPRVHVECDYVGAVTHEDLLDIQVTLHRVGASSFTLGFFATLDSRPVAKGNIVVVAMNRRTGRSCPLPEEFAARLRAHLAQTENVHA